MKRLLPLIAGLFLASSVYGAVPSFQTVTNIVNALMQVQTNINASTVTNISQGEAKSSTNEANLGNTFVARSGSTMTGPLTNNSRIAGNGNGLTNVAATDMRYGPVSTFPVLNTNVFYLYEALPHFTNDTPLAGSVGVLGKYVWSNSVYTSGQSLIFKTNVAAGKDVWVIYDFADGGYNLFWLTNDASPSVFPVGPWFPDSSIFTINFSITQTNLLFGVIEQTNSVPLAQQARESFRTHPNTRNSVFSGSAPIVEVALFPANLQILTNAVNFIVTNRLQGIVDVVELDRWVGDSIATGRSRDAAGNQIFSTVNYPGLTLPAFTDYLHTNGLKAGLHQDYGVFDPTGQGVNGETGSQGYYHQDATNLLANGVDFVMIDSTATPSTSDKEREDLMLEYIREFRDAQIQYSRPLFIHGAFAGSWTNNFNDWMIAADGFYIGNDTGTVTNYLKLLHKSYGWLGLGRYLTLVNPEDIITTNTTASRAFVGLCAITPSHAQLLNTTSLTTNMIWAITNDEVRTIWRDAAGAPGWMVSSNNIGEVWARQLANGDLAVAFIDTYSAGTLSVTWDQLKFSSTNRSLICRDVFERTNVTKTMSLSRALVANEGSLWRIYNPSDTNSFTPQFANYVSSLATGGATNITPWTSDIDGAGKDLTNAANGTFTNSITVGSSANTNVTLKLAGGGTFTITNGVSAKTWKFLPTGEALGTFQSPTNPLPAANIIAMGEYDYTTNAAFPISGFSGVNGTSYNYGILHVKNTGSTFAITPPTGCRSTNGTWYCTNDTTITAKIIPGRATNVICYPEW